ncbi:MULTISPECIES: hypothetical protein [Fructobacillus]|uniref:Uncharacterized protein n=1 Tax=Fructobacillus durionis TaxID=283737 RepID=A0A1I1HTX7_9LACO|nr:MULTISPECIES: hypothetical protein [Fructobacillus]MBD9366400.1 hypothetical protein [Leuconostoc mesenteroides]MBC9119202.1 hypothetical protein [Fructobacillus fructosus]MCK8639044.1 hypothetical protein [Fructobacillus fructosus]SFC24440.1 hypothetical protein SAMN05660453_0039 [Fructobacillus durionis]GAP01457.1 short chain dehydrogenase [Fructobacillus fructosus]
MVFDPNGSRMFTIKGLMEEMKTSREKVELLINMPGCPEFYYPTQKRPVYPEAEMAAFIKAHTTYRKDI